VDGTGKGQMVDVVHTWTATGTNLPQFVYGYFITDGANNLVFAEQNVPGGFQITAAGVSFSVQVTVTDKVDPSP